MQWSDVITPPRPKLLRQFAGLWLVFFVGIAAWRAWHGDAGARTQITGAVGAVVGLVGLVAPMSVRYLYTGWMIAAFPIGWTVSRITLALIFYGLFTPVSWLFKATGRDALFLKKRRAESYWMPRKSATDAAEYFRQS